MKPENRSVPGFIDTQRCHQVLLLDLHAVQHQRTEAYPRQIPLEKLVHPSGAHRDELLAHRRLLDRDAFSDSRTVGP
jgi:hypothetical protein